MRKQICKKCGHEWTPRIDNTKMCPKCKTYNWNDDKVWVEDEPQKNDGEDFERSNL